MSDAVSRKPLGTLIYKSFPYMLVRASLVLAAVILIGLAGNGVRTWLGFSMQETAGSMISGFVSALSALGYFYTRPLLYRLWDVLPERRFQED
jgi:hypothetical protein